MIIIGNCIIWVIGLNKIIKNLFFSNIIFFDKLVEIWEDFGVIFYIYKME